MSAELVSRFGKLFSDKSFKALMKSYDNLLVTGMSMGKKLSKPTFVLAILQSFKHGKEFTGEELERIFHILDTNNNGFLELDEFIAGVRVSIAYRMSSWSHVQFLTYIISYTLPVFMATSPVFSSHSHHLSDCRAY
jgi:EF hand